MDKDLVDRVTCIHNFPKTNSGDPGSGVRDLVILNWEQFVFVKILNHFSGFYCINYW